MIHRQLSRKLTIAAHLNKPHKLILIQTRLNHFLTFLKFVWSFDFFLIKLVKGKILLFSGWAQQKEIKSLKF